MSRTAPWRPAREREVLGWVVVVVLSILILMLFATRSGGDDRPLAVWRALEHQRAREYNRALGAWALVELEPAAEVGLRIDDLKEVERALTRASAIQADNAVVHCEFGLLRMTQTARL